MGDYYDQNKTMLFLRTKGKVMMNLKTELLNRSLDFLGSVSQKPIAALTEIENRAAAQFMSENLTHQTSVFSSEQKLRAHFFSESSLSKSKGLILDFGVFRGRSTLVMANAIRDDESRQVHAFDSFVGLRDPWSKIDRGVGSLDLQGRPPKSLVNHPKVSLNIGWVEDTLERFLDLHGDELGTAHLDFDVYPPTAFTLKTLKSRMVPGSRLIFDDFFGFVGWRQHSFKAFTEELNHEDWLLEAISPKQAVFSLKG